MSDSEPTGDYATPAQTRAHYLSRTTRRFTPVRNTFVQTPPPPPGRRNNSPSRAGPLAEFVTNGDLRGLLAYLLVLALTSAENSDGWATTLDNRIWARLLGTTETTGSAASEPSTAAIAAAYRTFTRLESRALLHRERVGRRQTRLTLLREDGTDSPYTRPDGIDDNRFLKLPHAFWKHMDTGDISIAGVAMLLVAAKEPSGFELRAEYSRQWYGWSPDTTQKGFAELDRLGIISIEKRLVPAPSSPTGQTQINTYRLRRPYTHLGRKRPKKKP
jgi:hypothetical protein